MLIGGVMVIGSDILFEASASTMRWNFIFAAKIY